MKIYATIFGSGESSQHIKIEYSRKDKRENGMIVIDYLKILEKITIQPGDLHADLDLSISIYEQEQVKIDCEIEGILYWKAMSYNVDELSAETGVREFAI